MNIRRRKRNKKSKHHDEEANPHEQPLNPDQQQLSDQLNDVNIGQLEEEVNQEELKDNQHFDNIVKHEELKEYSHPDNYGPEGEVDWRNDNTKAAQIIDEMALWIDDDNQSNLKNLPALKKLQFTPHLLMELKNLQVRYKFLDMGGCKYLADWLSKLPDGSLPWINIIEAGLEIADFLPIEKEHLIESKLGKAVEKI